MVWAGFAVHSKAVEVRCGLDLQHGEVWVAGRVQRRRMGGGVVWY